MTGFGRAEGPSETFLLTVEARSVNHRHLDVALRFPRALVSLETPARKLVASRVERGRIDISVQIGTMADGGAPRVVADAVLARDYLAQARALAGQLGIAPDVSLGWVLDRPGVLRIEELEPPEPEALWPALEAALHAALDALIAQRATEGAALAVELDELMADLHGEVEHVTARAPAAAARRE